jgi:carotenoid cleavage dioxygenase-like enzyme
MDDNRARKDALANPSYAAWPRAFSDIQREHGFEPLRVQGRLLLRKTDVAKHSARQLDFGSETYPSEPVFVPRSAARAEDDGYLQRVRGGHGTWLDARWSAPHPFQQ